MLIVALISTVVLLVWMGFFMMGSLPLLILKHDTPVDSRFIRGLFNVYYVALMVARVGRCVESGPCRPIGPCPGAGLHRDPRLCRPPLARRAHGSRCAAR